MSEWEPRRGGAWSQPWPNLLELVRKQRDWLDDAACSPATASLFHPKKGDAALAAKLICNGDRNGRLPACPVRAQCLDWALSNHIEGPVLGGMSTSERRKLRDAAS